MSLFGGMSKSGANKPALLLRLAFVLICFAVLIFLAQLWNSAQPIKSISISGTSFLSPAEVKAAIDDTAIINVPKNKIQYDRIASKLKSNPFIAETFMHEGIHSLNIEVKERNPIALLANDYGELMFVDKDALILPYRLFRSAIDMPIISGVYNGEKLDSNALLFALNILDEIKSPRYEFLFNFISEVHYNMNTGSFDLFTSDSGTKIIIGNMDNMGEKISNLYDFFQYKFSNQQSRYIKYIDARWTGHIVAKYQDNKL